MKQGKPAVPQEPLGKDGKQTLTLQVMVLKEASTLKASPHCQRLHCGTTHTQTPAPSETHTYTRTHARTQPWYPTYIHYPLSCLFGEESTIDPD